MAHQRWHVKRPLIFFACDVDCPTDWLAVRQRIKGKGRHRRETGLGCFRRSASHRLMPENRSTQICRRLGRFL